MRSSWAARVLLPATQVLAEGGWLAVAYAAVQVLGHQTPRIGPIELALLAWAGMAWARRRRWHSQLPELLGLPVLALLGAAIGWILAPEVRGALLDGHLGIALSLHPAGWLAGVAVLRGAAHRSRQDDDAVQQHLLRLAIPGLALPWLIGQASSSGVLEREFTEAAFMGTLIFAASSFTALGLAHLESVRLSTGSDWRTNRSWLTLVLGVAASLTAVGIPAAAFLGVPASALLATLFGPLRIALLVLLLLATPVIAAAAWVADLLPHAEATARPLLPNLRTDPLPAVTSAPTIVFYAVFGILLVVELVFLALIIYLRWQERTRLTDAPDGFEERSIVVPSEPRRPKPVVARGPLRRRDADDPAAAYLTALEALQRDGRWARAIGETPAEHARRVRGAGLPDPSLSRLASAYQLLRYGGVRLGVREARRARGRLARLRSFLGG